MSRPAIVRLVRGLGQGLGVARRFAGELRAHRASLTLVLLAGLGAIGLELLRPWPVQWIFDRALTGAVPDDTPARTVVVQGMVALLVVAVLKAVLEYLGRMRTTAIGHAVTRSIRYRLFEHVTRLSPSFHRRHKSGDLLVRLMGDVTMLRTMLVDSSVALVTRAALVLGMLVVMFGVDAPLTLALVAMVPLYLLVLRLFSVRLTTAVRKQRRKEGTLADFVHEALAATPDIQALGGDRHAVRRFARDNRRDVRAGMKTARIAARMGASVEVLLGLTVAVLLGYGGSRVLAGHLTPGELLVFLSYVRGTLKPVRSAARHAEKYAKGAACGERILAVLDAPVEVRSPERPVPLPGGAAELRFEGVRVHYDGARRAALRGLDASFRLGELCGICGPSGAGKSTLAALAVRLFDPDAGRVTLGGVDLRELDLVELRAASALATQEPVLFGDSIRENLLLAAPEADDGELLDACERAGLGPVLARLPEGLDTVLGAAGRSLSGGERRRLSLARALLRPGRLLVVDEPLAGLDRETAARVLDGLRAEAGRRIVVLVAHDPEHLGELDRLLFLREGRIEAEGTHAELERDSAPYRRVMRLGVEAR